MNTQKVMAAAEFKQKCLALMDEVAATGMEFIITKHGSPICKLTPLPKNTRESRFGWLKGSVTMHVDLTEPAGDIWEANQ